MTPHAGKDVEQREHSSISDVSANWQLLWKSIWQYFIKWRIYITQGYGIPFLGIYAKDEASYSKDTCSTIFIVPLYIIARP